LYFVAASNFLVQKPKFSLLSTSCVPINAYKIFGMRKLQTLLLCLSFALHSSSLLAANITWTGLSGGSWNVGSNWAGGIVPGSGDNVTFNTSVTVLMNGLTINITSLNVSNNSTVVFSCNGNTDLNVSAASNALQVGSGSSLKIFTVGATSNLHISLLSGASGSVNGTFIVEGDTDPTGPWGATLSVNSGATLTVSGSGIVTANPHAGIVDATGTVSFSAGSNYIQNDDGGVIPQATWDPASTIQVTGSTGNLPSFPGTNLSLGNLTINCPNIANAFPFVYSLQLFDNTTIKGDLQVLNFNGMTLVLLGNSGSPSNLVTINKNFVLSTNATVQLAFTENDYTKDQDYTLQVNGNFVQSAGIFSLQGNDIVTGTSKLGVKGNINQTGGQFTATSIATSSSKNLFVVEPNGNAAQTISAGTIDNANNQIALRLNNTSGGVALSTPLQVGRIDMQSGVLTTNVSNIITIRSTDPNQAVTNGNSSSYVNGPVIRTTSTTDPYRFPTGSNGFYRPIEVIPSTTAASSFTANYFRTANGSPVAAPLQGISSAEYWSIARAFGSDASVQLILNGQAVPGAAASSALVVAGNSGSQWTSVQGATGTSYSPGNAVNAIVKSDILSSFNFFTFGVIGSPLPVILLDFTATKSGSSANLKWSVDAVDIPQSVEILKSNNGRDFTKVGTVPGLEGVTTYNYTDPLSDGNNYYRLRLIDKDGSVVYSKVAAILNQANGFAITGFAPTLVTRSVKLSVSSGSGGTMDLYITDMSGRVWRKFGVQVSTGNNEQQLDLSDLSAGVYQVFGVMNGERTSLIRFVKQ
jgi:hypothetical protein